MSALAEQGRGQRDRHLLICETERKTFCLTYKNTGRHSASRRTRAGALGRNEVKLYRRTMESRVGAASISFIQCHFLQLGLIFVFCCLFFFPSFLNTSETASNYVERAVVKRPNPRNSLFEFLGFGARCLSCCFKAAVCVVFPGHLQCFFHFVTERSDTTNICLKKLPRPQ